MACDEGRVGKVLLWVLREGHGDDDFRRYRDSAIAGVATNEETKLLGAMTYMLEHDHGSLHAARECARERPGCLVEWGREIVG